MLIGLVERSRVETPVSYRLSEEESLVQATVRRFAEDELRPLVDAAERTGRFPRQVLPRMAALGLLAIGVPPERGGAGGTSLMLALVAEEVARICGGFAIGVMASVLSPGIVARTGGGPSVLEPLLRGEVLPAMAFTEPAAGSDLAGLQSTVRPTADGLVLRGAKTFISNAPTADVYLVAAVRADHAAKPREERVRGMGLWVVSRGAPGLVVGPPLAKLGMRSSETGELTFDDVPVLPPPGGPGGGRGDGGFRAMMALLDVNRLYIAGLSLGLAQAAFEACVAYVQARHAFGKPIAEHQATGFKVARMAMKLDAARALLQRACEAFDAGERATRLVSEAKLFTTEAAVEITGDAVQIHGGYGYMEAFPVERYFRDAKVGTIWEGTSEIQQHVICRELGLYR